MCKMYGLNLWKLFFYKQGLSSLHWHKLYDKFIDMIFGCFDNNPQFVYDMQETYLKMCLLNIVWKPRDVFLVDGISQLRCLYTIQADANVVKLKGTKVWQEEEKETEEEQKDIIKNIKKNLLKRKKNTGRYITKFTKSVKCVNAPLENVDG